MDFFASDIHRYLGTISNYCASGKPKCQRLRYSRFQLLDQIYFSWISLIKMYLMESKNFRGILRKESNVTEGGFNNFYTLKPLVDLKLLRVPLTKCLKISHFRKVRICTYIYNFLKLATIDNASNNKFTGDLKK